MLQTYFGFTETQALVIGVVMIGVFIITFWLLLRWIVRPAPRALAPGLEPGEKVAVSVAARPGLLGFEYIGCPDDATYLPAEILVTRGDGESAVYALRRDTPAAEITSAQGNFTSVTWRKFGEPWIESSGVVTPGHG